MSKVPEDGQYLAIKNWEKYQGTMRYGKAVRSWIKDYPDKDGDENYSRLTMCQRYLLDACCRLRARIRGNITNNPTWIARALCIIPAERSCISRNIRVLVALGFLVVTGQRDDQNGSSIYGTTGYRQGTDEVPPVEHRGTDEVPPALLDFLPLANQQDHISRREESKERGEEKRVCATQSNASDLPPPEFSFDQPEEQTPTSEPTPITTPITPKRPTPKVTKEQVASIYDQYPRKLARSKAIESIERACHRLLRHEDCPANWTLNSPDEVVNYLVQRTRLFAGSNAGQRGVYTPHGSTWFNQSRYMDDAAEWCRKERSNGGESIRAQGQRQADRLDEILDREDQESRQADSDGLRGREQADAGRRGAEGDGAGPGLAVQ